MYGSNIPRMDEKKLTTREFQLKSIGGDMRWKLLQKRSTGKTTGCSKHLRHISIEKDIFSELNRCICQIPLKYITWPPLPLHQNKNFCPPSPSPPSKDFSKIFTPPPSPHAGGALHAMRGSLIWKVRKIFRKTNISYTLIRTISVHVRGTKY